MECLKKILSNATCLALIGGISLVAGDVTTFETASAESSEPTYGSSDIPEIHIPAVRPEYAGATVATVPLVNKALSERHHLVDASAGVLPEYLLEAGFQPVEFMAGGDQRAAMSEIEYGQSNHVNPSTAARVGQNLGAKYVFIGEVNTYRVIKPNVGRSVKVLGGFGIGQAEKSITYDLQVSGRIVDVKTRAIIAAKTVAHKQTFKGKGNNLETPWGNFEQKKETDVENEVGGKVLAIALNRLVAKMVNQLNRRPPPRSN